MSVKDKIKVSMETIAFQNGDFFKALIKEIQLIKDQSTNEKLSLEKTGELIAKSKISSIVREYTNLNIELVVIDVLAYSAGVIVPVELDKNHPFFDDYKEGMIQGKDGIKLIKKHKEPLKAGIDLNTGKVYGHYSKVKSYLYLYSIMFSDPHIFADELAAIILHEIGHIFSYLEFVSCTFKTNVLLRNAVTEFLKTDDYKQREIVLDVFNDVANTNVVLTETLLKSKSEKQVQTILLSATIDAKRSELGNPVYDQRTFEQLADEYATKQGAGLALAKIFVIYGDKVTSRSKQYFTIAVTGTFTLLGLVFLLPIFVCLTFVLMVISDPNNKIYDDPNERLENIKKQLIGALKDKSIPANRSKQIVLEIKTIENLLKEYHSNENFYTMLWKLSSSRRSIKNDIDFQKRLEGLSSNNLYVLSSQFKTLKV